jgi:hypothetical protein
VAVVVVLMDELGSLEDMFIYEVGEEIYLYVVPATNLLLVSRAK